MLTDIHSHILPGVDDGAKDTEESVKLLNLMRKQGITKVIATPHFYGDISDTPSSEKETVRRAFESIKTYIPDGMRVLTGFEVHYFDGISDCSQLSSLTIENSNFMLLELPQGISERVANEITALHLNCGINIVLAHIERYCGDRNFGEILSLIEDGFAVGQVNCDTLLDRRGRNIALKLIKDGYASLVATDAHSVVSRPPRISAALKCVGEKLGEEVKKALIDNADNLFEKAEGNL